MKQGRKNANIGHKKTQIYRFPKESEHKNKKTGSFMKLIMSAFLIAAVVFCCLLTKDAKADLKEAEADLQQAKEDRQVAIMENKEVQLELERLKDPEYLLHIARRDYYYTKPDETMFDLEELQDPLDDNNDQD